MYWNFRFYIICIYIWTFFQESLFLRNIFVQSLWYTFTLLIRFSDIMKMWLILKLLKLLMVLSALRTLKPLKVLRTLTLCCSTLMLCVAVILWWQIRNVKGTVRELYICEYFILRFPTNFDTHFLKQCKHEHHTDFWKEIVNKKTISFVK